MISTNDLPMEDTEEDAPVHHPTQEEQDRLGYCIRCIAPKPYAGAPDLCGSCELEIDRFLNQEATVKKQRQMVYLVWEHHPYGDAVLGVYADKDRAEAVAQEERERDAKNLTKPPHHFEVVGQLVLA